MQDGVDHHGVEQLQLGGVVVGDEGAWVGIAVTRTCVRNVQLKTPVAHGFARGYILSPNKKLTRLH